MCMQRAKQLSFFHQKWTHPNIHTYFHFPFYWHYTQSQPAVELECQIEDQLALYYKIRPFNEKRTNFIDFLSKIKDIFSFFFFCKIESEFNFVGIFLSL